MILRPGVQHSLLTAILIGAVSVIASCALGCKASNTDIRKGVAELKANVARSMAAVASQAKIRIDTEQVEITAHEEALFAASPVSTDPTTALVYVSIPGYACQDAIPDGYYVLRFPGDSGGQRTAQLADLQGRIVASGEAMQGTLDNPRVRSARAFVDFPSSSGEAGAGQGTVTFYYEDPVEMISLCYPVNPNDPGS